MARTVLSLQTTARTGTAITYSAATADGHAIDNTSERVVFHVKNGSGSPVTVTIDAIAMTDDGTLAVSDRTVSVPGGEERIIGPFPNSFYGQADVGLSLTKAVYINTSAQTSVTYAAIKLGDLP